ncbi:MAG: metallophosphoesterase family protein [Verrucomicrobia bacterium]|nr:metallophosphoesterase family protein [Verrucomicrobiota bacterium]
MKIALLADIHANLPALEAVLADAFAVGAKRFTILGDSVNYGHQPRECLHLIGELDAICVLGNHDLACSYEPSEARYRGRAERMSQRTATLLRPEQRAWLRSLPLVVMQDDCTFAHANLHDPSGWAYVFSPEEAALSLARQTTRIGFIGHTHQSRVFLGPDGVSQRGDGCIELTSAEKYLVNVGSVGQPRDHAGDDACYCLYDAKAGVLEFRRVSYSAEPGRAAALAVEGVAPRNM